MIINPRPLRAPSPPVQPPPRPASFRTAVFPGAEETQASSLAASSAGSSSSGSGAVTTKADPPPPKEIQASHPKQDRQPATRPAGTRPAGRGDPIRHTGGHMDAGRPSGDQSKAIRPTGDRGEATRPNGGGKGKPINLTSAGGQSVLPPHERPSGGRPSRGGNPGGGNPGGGSPGGGGPSTLTPPSGGGGETDQGERGAMPRPSRTVFDKPYIVQQGDTMESITRLFGRASWAYGELVAANTDQNVTYDYSAPGLSPKICDLWAGRALRIPSNWRPCASCQKRSSITEGRLGDPRAFFHDVRVPGALAHSKGVLGDPTATEKEGQVFDIIQNGSIQPNNLDPIQLDISDLAQPAIQAAAAAGRFPSAAAALPGILNFIADFWRQMFPNSSPKSGDADVKALFDQMVTSAIEWYARYGQYIDPQLAAAIPFGSIPFTNGSDFKALAPNLALVDWGAVQGYLKHRSVSEVSAQTESLAMPSWATDPAKMSSAEASIVPWGTMPWDRIPWVAVPLAKIDAVALQKAVDAAGPSLTARQGAATTNFLTQLGAIYGVPFVPESIAITEKKPPVSSNRPPSLPIRHPAGPGSLFPAFAGPVGRGGAANVKNVYPPQAKIPGQAVPPAPNDGSDQATKTPTKKTTPPDPGSRPPVAVPGAPTSIQTPANAAPSNGWKYGVLALCLAVPAVLYGGVLLGGRMQASFDKPKSGTSPPRLPKATIPPSSKDDDEEDEDSGIELDL